jgi:hypothetical protein
VAILSLARLSELRKNELDVLNSHQNRDCVEHQHLRCEEQYNSGLLSLTPESFLRAKCRKCHHAECDLGLISSAVRTENFRLVNCSRAAKNNFYFSGE